MEHKSETDHLESAPNLGDNEMIPDPKATMIPEKGVDDALGMALDSQEETWTEDEERRVLRKIDLVVIPMVR